MQASDYLPLRRVRDFGDVLNATFQFLKLNVVGLGKSLLFFAAPFALLTSAGTLLFQRSSVLQAGTPDLLASDWTELILGYVLMLGGSLLTTLFAALTIYSYLRLYQERQGATFEVRDVWSTMGQHFLPFLGVMCLIGLVFMLGLIINVVPCLGTLAYFVGLIYCIVTFSLAYPVLMQEEVGVVASLQRSWFLVRDAWWPTAGILLVAYIISGILGTIFNMPGFFMGLVLGATTVEGGAVSLLLQIGLALGTLAGSIGTTLLYSIPLLAVGIQYFSLVEQKERTGLMTRVHAMEEAEPPATEAAAPDADTAADAGTLEEPHENDGEGTSRAG